MELYNVFYSSKLWIYQAVFELADLELSISLSCRSGLNRWAELNGQSQPQGLVE